jgi:hypothetical protein
MRGAVPLFLVEFSWCGQGKFNIFTSPTAIFCSESGDNSLRETFVRVYEITQYHVPKDWGLKMMVLYF